MRPNLLMIVSDDQGAWAMGCAGNAELKTPALDRLAAEGTRFTHFFCASPVCSPARASMLTGAIPSRHGIHDWLSAGYINRAELAPSFRERLSAEPVEPMMRWAKGNLLHDKAIDFLRGRRTFTGDLAEAGYECALSGKWHLGDAGRPQAGFSWWRPIAMGGDNYYHATFLTQSGFDALDGVYITDRITDNALEYLDTRDQTRPFCLCVHYTAPHSPWEKEHHPNADWEMYDDCEFASTPDLPLHEHSIYLKRLDTPAKAAEFRRTSLHGYFAAVSAMDRNITRLLDKLDDLGLAQDTMVFFTGDNGMNMGHHGVFGKGNGTFPQNMYDESVLVPALARWPGRVPAGRVSGAMLSHCDLYPTISEALGVPFSPPSEPLPGVSFAPHLLGGPERGSEEIVIQSEYGPARMIRTAEWKYVHRYPYGHHELYNLACDPGEEVNLAGEPEHAGIETSLRGRMEQWFLRYSDPRVDGRSEPAHGSGQIDLAGALAEGRKNYADKP